MAQLPLSKVVIEEQAGKKRKLELQGGGLPFRGAPWTVQQRMVTDPVPGNADDSIQQVLGPNDEPSSWEGFWRTTQLSSKPAVFWDAGKNSKIALAFTLYQIVDDICRSGQLCRVTWSVGGRKIERLGRLAMFTAKPDRIDDIGWEIEWQWIGRGPARQSVASFRGDQKAALAKSVQLELGKLTGEIEAAKLATARKGVPFSADSFSLGGLEAFLNAPREFMAGFARLATQLASRIKTLGELIESIETLPADLASQALDAATTVVAACAEFDQAVSVRGPEALVAFDQSASVQGLVQAASYFGDAQTQAETTMKAAAELRLAAQRAQAKAPGVEGSAGTLTPDLQTVILARQGDTFTSLAIKFNLGPELGAAIAKANNLPPYQVAPAVGTLLVIPNAKAAAAMGV